MMLLTLGMVAAPPEVDCENPSTQLDMNLCAAREYEAADTVLNEVWVAASDKAKANDALADDPKGEESSFDKLLAAQRAWITYRNAHCAAEADRYRGGSIVPLIHATCMTALTEARTMQLREYTEEG